MCKIFSLYFTGSHVYQTVLCAKLTYFQSMKSHFSAAIYLTNLQRCWVDKCDASTPEKTHVWMLQTVQGQIILKHLPTISSDEMRTLSYWNVALINLLISHPVGGHLLQLCLIVSSNWFFSPIILRAANYKWAGFPLDILCKYAYVILASVKCKW